MSSINRGQSFNITGNSNTVGNIFTTGGNIGIGTTSPGYTLDIIGNSRISNTFSGGQTLLTILQPNLTNDAVAMVIGQSVTVGGPYKNSGYLSFGYYGNGNTANSLNMGYYGGFGPSISLINPSGVAGTGTINLNGNVGICTSAPSYKLDVNSGSGGFNIRTIGSGIDSSVIRFENTNANGQIYHVGSTASGSGAGRGFSIYDVTNSINRVLVGSSGNIGIGISSPSTALHVNTNTPGSNYSSLLLDNSNSRVAIQTWSYSGNTKGTLRLAHNAYWDASGNTTLFNTALPSWSMEMGTNTDSLFVYRFNTSGSFILPFAIASSGNIGISTNSPSVTLDLKGQQYISPSSFTTTGAGSQSTLIAYPKMIINTNTNAWPATSGTIGSNIALRLRGNDDAVLDFGVNSINAWIQNTNPTGYNNNYNIILNPNGGNIGIATGTNTPGYTLDVNGTSRFTGILYGDNVIRSNYNATIFGAISIRCSPQSNGAESSIGFYQNINEGGAVWVLGHNPGSVGNGNFGIYNSTLSKNMFTITSQGNLYIIGSTQTTARFSSDADPYIYFGPSITAGTGDARLNVQDRAANAISFYAGTTKQGGITATGGITTYLTSSDYRIKENVVNIDNACNRVKQLNVRRFNFIGYPERTIDGFLAHEVSEVVPEAIHGEKDAVDSDGKPVYQQIDQSKLVPLLTGALKEAILKIETLEQFIKSKFPDELLF